ncbi:MAG: hypothetical protein AB7E27_05305 [Candidatus Methanomethylophilaceae archaeon]|jgi:hypothetical protein
MLAGGTFYKADAEYGSRMSQALGLGPNRVNELAAMGKEERVAAT